MRQKKSKTILWIFALILILVAGFFVAGDFSVPVEHVEEPLENDFLKR